MAWEKRWERIRAGVIGHFAVVPADDCAQRPGMLRLGAEGASVVMSGGGRFLDDDHLPPACNALVGRTEVGSVLLLGVNQRGSSIGDYPTTSYRTGCVVLDIDEASIDGDRVSAVRLAYEGLAAWSGIGNLSDDAIRDPAGELVGWKAEVRFQEPHVAELDVHFQLHVAAGWSVDGPRDRRTIGAPLYFRVESTSRRSIGEHLQRLDAVHALLAVCQHPHLKATSGDVRIASDGADWSGLWERHLMTTDFTSPPNHEFPRLTFDDINGVNGVARWVELALAHRRAVEPIVRHTMFENQSPESRLLSTAASMEYWVGLNARKDDWARKDGKPLPNALTNRVSPEWRQWIGEPETWVERFWQAYLDLKHYRHPADGGAPDEIHALELSARWLLTAALLDECAGSRSPSRRLFAGSLWQLGQSVRATLGFATK